MHSAKITSGEMIDPTTGIWTSTGTEEPSLLNAVAPATSEVLASTIEHADVCLLAVQGSADIQSCDPFKPSSGADRHDVRRMGLAECRVAVFHISSYAWRNSYEETCRRWAGFITQCLIHQVDFVQGDGNLFAQRNFKRDVHSDYRTCILVDILSRVLTEIHLHRNPTNRITYNICSSTSAAAYLKSTATKPRRQHGQYDNHSSLLWKTGISSSGKNESRVRPCGLLCRPSIRR